MQTNYSATATPTIPPSRRLSFPDTTPQQLELMFPNGKTHTIKALETENEATDKALTGQCYKKVITENQNLYLSEYLARKVTKQFPSTTSEKIKKYFDTKEVETKPSTKKPPKKQQAKRKVDPKKQADEVMKTAKRHFIQMAIDAKTLEKNQFLEQEYDETTFTIIKQDENSYNIATLGKKIGTGWLKRAHIFVPIIEGQTPEVAYEYTTEDSEQVQERIKRNKKLDFQNYTMLREKMSSHTDLLLSLKKYTSPTQEEKIIAEMCDGDVNHLVDTLSPEEKVRFAIQGAQLLKAIHAAGYVYFDFKPSNLLIKTNKETKQKELRLCDFEFVLRSGTPANRGTPDFMPPEMMPIGDDNFPIATSAMDAFSYGATLHFLFPLAPETPKLVTWRSVQNQETERANIPKKQAELRASLNPIHSLIADCIDLDPTIRPSMEEVEKRLEAIKLSQSGEAEKKPIVPKKP